MPLLPLIPRDESWRMPYIWRSSNETNQLILVTHITKSVLFSLRFCTKRITLHWRKIDNDYDQDIFHDSVAVKQVNETNQLILVTHNTKSVMLFLLCSLRFRFRQITLHWRKIDNYYDHDIYHNSVAAGLKVCRCTSASSGLWTSVITSAVQQKKAWLAFAHLGAVDAVSNNLLFISNIITCKFCET